MIIIFVFVQLNIMKMNKGNAKNVILAVLHVQVVIQMNVYHVPYNLIIYQKLKHVNAMKNFIQTLIQVNVKNVLHSAKLAKDLKKQIA